MFNIAYMQVNMFNIFYAPSTRYSVRRVTYIIDRPVPQNMAKFENNVLQKIIVIIILIMLHWILVNQPTISGTKIFFS